MSAVALYSVIGVFAVASVANASDLRPTFASEVVAPDANMVLPLLKVICGKACEPSLQKASQRWAAETVQ
jgi:hypothetical protein